MKLLKNQELCVSWLNVDEGRLALFNMVIEKTGIAIFINDYNIPGVHWANDNMSKILGYDNTELANLPVKELKKIYHPDDFYIFADRYEFHSSKNNKGKTYKTIYRVKHKNGKYIWTYFSSFLLASNPDGTPRYVAGFMLDLKNLTGDFSLLEKFLEGNARSRNESLLSRLTRREKEILRLLTKGISAVKIAEKLNLSRHTVLTHKKNIYQKLNIKSIFTLASFTGPLFHEKQDNSK